MGLGPGLGLGLRLGLELGLGLGLGLGIGIGLGLAQVRRVSIWRRIAMVSIAVALTLAVRWLSPLRGAVRWLPPQAQMPLGTCGAPCLRTASELREKRLVVGLGLGIALGVTVRVIS